MEKVRFSVPTRCICMFLCVPHNKQRIYYYYYYRYSALGPVWAETRAQLGDWYSSGTLHPGQVLRGRLPLLSPETANTSVKMIKWTIFIIKMISSL
jgi:hypothetical protein